MSTLPSARQIEGMVMNCFAKLLPRLRPLSVFTLTCFAFLFHTRAVGQTTLQAISEFSNINAGTVPYYIDNQRGALAINASIEANRDKFARATATFTGSTGDYDLTLTSLRELDGESTYRVYINNQLVGSSTNSTTATDYAPQNHVFNGVTIANGATIAVESNSVSNGKVPENGAFAYARGRWTTLEISGNGVTPTEDSVSGINFPTVVSPASSYTVDIPYTATTSRDVVAIIHDPSGAYVDAQKMTVSAGSGIATITIDLSSALSVGSGYEWRARIREVGGDWTTNIGPGANVDFAVAAASAELGRLAVVADGNYRDSDDICATPVSLALLKCFGLDDRLVHYSHSCDLIPGPNDPGGADREEEMQISCDGSDLRWGPFENVNKYYNCITERSAMVQDLKNAINTSTASDPLWIVEAGEPDVIYDAMVAASSSARANVFIITHHPANDAGDNHDLSDIEALPGYVSSNTRRIPNQNPLLKKPLAQWHWARDHTDTRIQWLWERGYHAQTPQMNYTYIVGDFDCSDAGMVYFWATGRWMKLARWINSRRSFKTTSRLVSRLTKRCSSMTLVLRIRR